MALEPKRARLRDQIRARLGGQAELEGVVADAVGRLMDGEDQVTGGTGVLAPSVQSFERC